MEFLDLLREFGPLAGVALFFIWRDFRREDRLATRIEKLEDEQREIILPLVEKSTDVISRNTIVMERLEDLIVRGSNGQNVVSLHDHQRG